MGVTRFSRSTWLWMRNPFHRVIPLWPDVTYLCRAYLVSTVLQHKQSPTAKHATSRTILLHALVVKSPPRRVSNPIVLIRSHLHVCLAERRFVVCLQVLGASDDLLTPYRYIYIYIAGTQMCAVKYSLDEAMQTVKQLKPAMAGRIWI